MSSKQSHIAFLGMDLTSILVKIQELKLREPDEERPYDHLYEAADLCKAYIDQIKAHESASYVEDPAAAMGASGGTGTIEGGGDSGGGGGILMIARRDPEFLNVLSARRVHGLCAPQSAALIAQNTLC